MTDESQPSPFTYGIPQSDYDALKAQLSNIVLAGHKFRMGYRTEDDMRQHEGVLMAMIGNLLRDRETRLAAIQAAFDAYCYDGLELRGFTHLSAEASEKESETFDALYKAIKDA